MKLTTAPTSASAAPSQPARPPVPEDTEFATLVLTKDPQRTSHFAPDEEYRSVQSVVGAAEQSTMSKFIPGGFGDAVGAAQKLAAEHGNIVALVAGDKGGTWAISAWDRSFNDELNDYVPVSNLTDSLEPLGTKPWEWYQQTSWVQSDRRTLALVDADSVVDFRNGQNAASFSRPSSPMPKDAWPPR